jgi:hypothetical protein
MLDFLFLLLLHAFIKWVNFRSERKDDLLSEQSAGLKRIFNEDQLESMRRGSRQGKSWSESTVKKGLQLRFVCGTSGYEQLLSMGLPFPCVCSLQRRVQHIMFTPGLISPVFKLLESKVQFMNDQERLCVLCFDEMSLDPKFEFQIETGSFIGHVTLPDTSNDSNHSSLASKALVFNLAGLSSKWKQVVAYHFTGSSVSGNVLKSLVLDIISVCSQIGLFVVCDMGACNQAMWKSFGIFCNKNSMNNKIPHPSDSSKFLYFLPDVPHVLKNIRSHFVKGDEFVLDDEIVEQFNLISNVVTVDPVRDLFIFQDDEELLLSHKLNAKVLDVSSHYNKMNVANAYHLFDRRVSSALKLLVKEEGRNAENLTVAWFIEFVSVWFELCANRHPIMALSKSDEGKFDEVVTHLRNAINVFKGLKVGNGHFKPIQRAVILATTSLLEGSLELLDKYGYYFVLTGRINQDAVENLFSQIRIRNPTPSALSFSRFLKQICLSQYLHVPSSSNYHVDDSHTLADLMSDTKVKEDSFVDISLDLTKCPDLERNQEQCLYYLLV